MGHRAGQPEPDHSTLRHHRDRPRNHVGQRRSRQPSGAHGVRRHQRLLRHSRQAVAVQRAVPQPGRVAVEDRRRARRRCREPVFRLTRVATRHLQADHQQHRAGARRDGHHPDHRYRGRKKSVPQLHVDQELGQPRLLVDELRGDRGIVRQRRDLGRLPRDHPHARGRERELPDGRVPQAGTR